MNYYERYLGDYRKKTSRLRIADHGAYTLLLDEQYATEAGLPVEYAELFHICRAVSSAERESVRKVADLHFPVGEDGTRWNPRAQEEIAKAQRRIASSQKNGKNGGRPRKPGNNPTGFENAVPENPTETRRQTRSGEASPDPTRHSPIDEEQCAANAPPPLKPRPVNSLGTRLDPLWALPAEWAEWALETRADWRTTDVERVAIDFRDHWHAKAGKDARKVDWFATWRRWVRNERRDYKHRPMGSASERRGNSLDAVIAQGRVNGRDITGIAERVDRPPLRALSGDLREQGGRDVRLDVYRPGGSGTADGEPDGDLGDGTRAV